jgi:hypothetical protein
MSISIIPYRGANVHIMCMVLPFYHEFQASLLLMRPQLLTFLDYHIHITIISYEIVKEAIIPINDNNSVHHDKDIRMSNANPIAKLFYNLFSDHSVVCKWFCIKTLMR